MIKIEYSKDADAFYVYFGEDVVRNLIRLSGLVPDKDISITFVGVGMRPGEKLYEDLIGMNETAESSPAENILQIRSTSAPDAVPLTSRIAELEQLAVLDESAAVVEKLCEIVPTFRPGGEWEWNGKKTTMPEYESSY